MLIRHDTECLADDALAVCHDNSVTDSFSENAESPSGVSHKKTPSEDGAILSST
jgi:hypothetical protein